MKLLFKFTEPHRKPGKKERWNPEENEGVRPWLDKRFESADGKYRVHHNASRPRVFRFHHRIIRQDTHEPE